MTVHITLQCFLLHKHTKQHVKCGLSSVNINNLNENGGFSFDILQAMSFMFLDVGVSLSNRNEVVPTPTLKGGRGFEKEAPRINSPNWHVSLSQTLTYNTKHTRSYLRDGEFLRQKPTRRTKSLARHHGNT